jgi:hypothetical protein
MNTQEAQARIDAELEAMKTEHDARIAEMNAEFNIDGQLADILALLKI